MYNAFARTHTHTCTHTHTHTHTHTQTHTVVKSWWPKVNGVTRQVNQNEKVVQSWVGLSPQNSQVPVL